jgi:hypothetical protein
MRDEPLQGILITCLYPEIQTGAVIGKEEELHHRKATLDFNSKVAFHFFY